MSRGSRRGGIVARDRLVAVGLLSCLFCLVGAAAGATPAQIGEAELVVRSVRGEIEDVRRQVTIRDNVFSREVIETGPASATRLVFRDNTELSIGAESRVGLDRFVYDPDRGAGSLLLELAAGVFRWISGSMPSPSYGVRMPFGTLAVRGTVVGVDVEGGVVLVETGTVEVQLNAGATFVVREGQCLLALDPAGPRLVDRRECERSLGRYRAMLAALTNAELVELLCPGATDRAVYPAAAGPSPPGPAPSGNGTATGGDEKADQTAPNRAGRQGGPDTGVTPSPAADDTTGTGTSGPSLTDQVPACVPAMPAFGVGGGSEGGSGGGSSAGLPPAGTPTQLDEPPTWSLLVPAAFLLVPACWRRRRPADRQ